MTLAKDVLGRLIRVGDLVTVPLYAGSGGGLHVAVGVVTDLSPVKGGQEGVRVSLFYDRFSWEDRRRDDHLTYTRPEMMTIVSSLDDHDRLRLEAHMAALLPKGGAGEHKQ